MLAAKIDLAGLAYLLGTDSIPGTAAGVVALTLGTAVGASVPLTRFDFPGRRVIEAQLEHGASTFNSSRMRWQQTTGLSDAEAEPIIAELLQHGVTPEGRSDIAAITYSLTPGVAL